MELKMLIIEDDLEISKNLLEFYTDFEISGYLIKPKLTTSFDEGIQIVSELDFDIVILDLFKDGEEKDENAGQTVLDAIRNNVFIPVIFFTGHAYKIDHLKSEIVGIVRKGDGIEALTSEIERIISSKIALIKSNIYGHLKESLREYFWDTVDAQKDVFKNDDSSASLGYLILRRFANSLSKENIKIILKDENIKEDKSHPMEFYIYPSNKIEYQAGEILSKNGKIYCILTPNCDFVKESGRQRKVGRVLLVEAIPLNESDIYKNYLGNNGKYLQSLTSLIESRKGDRYFFLPKTPFINNYFLDFQIKIMVEYEELPTFERVALLDYPYAQSMVSSFTRYYNRIGFPDIDAEYVIRNL